jgi:hypothetical protein
MFKEGTIVKIYTCNICGKKMPQASKKQHKKYCKK